MKLIVKFKPTTLGFKKRTAFSFLPAPRARELNPLREGSLILTGWEPVRESGYEGLLLRASDSFQAFIYIS